MEFNGKVLQEVFVHLNRVLDWKELGYGPLEELSLFELLHMIAINSELKITVDMTEAMGSGKVRGSLTVVAPEEW